MAVERLVSFTRGAIECNQLCVEPRKFWVDFHGVGWVMPGGGEANIFGWVLGENLFVMFGMNKVILMIDRSIRKSLSLFIDVSYNNFIIIIVL